MSSVGPVNVLREEAKEEKGENARLQTFVGAIALADLVKTTLGPKGMDKILQAPSGKLTITNDGATILKSVVIDNPAAKVLIDISRVQEEEVGDGTTTVCVLAGELLRQAEKLVDQKYHPQTIIEGYRAATDIAMKALQEYSFSAEEQQKQEAEDIKEGTSSNSLLPQLKEDEEYSPLYLNMLNLARTTLSSKVLGSNVSNDSTGGIASNTSTSTLEHFSRMCVDAVCSVGGIQKVIKKGQNKDKDEEPVIVDLRMIPIIKIKGGNSTNISNDPSGLSPVLSNSALCDSFLIEDGLVMEHNASNWASVKCPATVRARRNVSSHYTVLRTLEDKEGNINVLCVNTPLDVDRVKIAGMKVKTKETGDESIIKDDNSVTGSRVRRTGCIGIEDEEKAKIRSKCKKLMNWGSEDNTKSNIDVLFSRQIVYDYPMSLFSNPSTAFGQKTRSNKGVLVFDNVGFDDVERLAILTKGKLVGCVMGNDEGEVTSSDDIGHCLSISEIMVGEETLTLVRSNPLSSTTLSDKAENKDNVKKSSCVSIVLRGSSDYLLDEAERSVIDALSALAMLVRCSKAQNDTNKQQQRNRSMRLVYGGGACECRMACAINEAADNGLTPYPPSILHGFANALIAIPEAVASNCGLPGRMVGEVLMAHHRKQYAQEKGREIPTGADSLSSSPILDACVSSRNLDGIGSARCSNGMSVVDTLLGKERILCGASEAAEEVIRVDSILTAAERKRQE